MVNRFWLSCVAPLLALAQISRGGGEEPPAATPHAAPQPIVVSEEALKLHRECLLVDGHNDLPYELREQADSNLDKLDISRHQATLQTDLPRLRQGGVGAQFWAAYVPVEMIARGESAKMAIEQIELIKRIVARYPDDLEMAYTADDIERIRASGKIASLIGVEGGHAIDNSVGTLRRLYKLGARYLTLAHADTLDWVDSATDAPRSNGLSAFGEEVVRTMNDLGMMVDISHISAEAMHDVLRTTRAPVIASHSSAFALAPHPRNVPDDALKAVAKNGGIVMVNFYSGFLVRERAEIGGEKTLRHIALRKANADDEEIKAEIFRARKQDACSPGTVHTVVDHIDHIVKVAGIDHVGLGSDYDGVSKLPAQMEDVSCYPNITQELLNRGYSHEAIRKILGKNFLRVMRAVEQAAREKN